MNGFELEGEQQIEQPPAVEPEEYSPYPPDWNRRYLTRAEIRPTAPADAGTPPGFFEDVGMMFEEGFPGTAIRWGIRQTKASGQPITDSFLAGLNDREAWQIASEQITDGGIARQRVIEIRAEDERRRRMANEGVLKSLSAGLISFIPDAIITFGLYGGASLGLRASNAALRAGLGVTDRLALDLAVNTAYNFGTEFARVGMNPTDGIEEAVVNGGIGTIMGSALLGAGIGIHQAAVRTAPSLAASLSPTGALGGTPLGGAAQRANIPGAVARWGEKERMRAHQHHERMALAHAASGLGRDFKFEPVGLGDFQERIGPAYGIGDQVWQTFGKEWNAQYHLWVNGKLDDGFRGEKFVDPRGHGEADGTQVLVLQRGQAKDKLPGQIATGDPAEWVVLERKGHAGLWAETSRFTSKDAAIADVTTRRPMRHAVDNFLNPEAHAWQQAKKVDLQRQYAQARMSDLERSKLIDTVLVREIGRMEDEVQVLQARLGDTVEAQKGTSPELVTAKARLAEAQRQYDLFIKERNVHDAPFQGAGAEKMVQLMRRTGQLPLWTLLASEEARSLPVGELWEEIAELLVGTNGAMIPNPERKAVESVYGAIRARRAARWNAFDQEIRDAFTEMHGMRTGIGPGRLRVNELGRKIERVSRKVWNRGSGAQTGMSWEEFDRAVGSGLIDFVANGTPHENPHVQKAIETHVRLMRELDVELRANNAYTSLQSQERGLIGLRAKIMELRERLGIVEGQEVRDAETGQPGVQAATKQTRGTIQTIEDAVRELEENEAIVGEDRLAYESAFVQQFAEETGINVQLVRIADLRDAEGLDLVQATNEWAGFAQQMPDGSTQIYLIDTKPGRRMPVLLHELGHAVDNASWKGLSVEQKDAVLQDFFTYRERLKSASQPIDYITARDLIGQDPHLIGAGRSNIGQMLSPEQLEWFKEFGEWKAEQIRYWMQTNEKPKTMVEAWFKNLADLWQKLLRIARNYKEPASSKAVDDWMRSIWRDTGKTPENFGLTRQFEIPLKAEGVRAWLESSALWKRKLRMDAILREKDGWKPRYSIGERLPPELLVLVDPVFKEVGDRSVWTFESYQNQVVKGAQDRGLPVSDALLNEVRERWVQRLEERRALYSKQKGNPNVNELARQIEEMRVYTRQERAVLDELRKLEQEPEGYVPGDAEVPPRGPGEPPAAGAASGNPSDGALRARLVTLEKAYASRAERLKESQKTDFDVWHEHRQWDADRINGNLDDFRALLREWYRIDPKEGTNPAPDKIEERVERTIARILGQEHPAPGAGATDLLLNYRNIPLQPGDLGSRKLNMPSTYAFNGIQARDFLQLEASEVTRSYYNKAAHVLEMTRAFGSPSGEGHLADVIAQSRREGMSEAEIEKLSIAFRDLRDVVTGNWGITDDPTRLTPRVLKAARQLNVLAFMGKVAQMQLIDMGNMVHAHGLKTLINAVQASFMNEASTLGQAIRKDSMELFGAASEIVQLSRVGMWMNDPVGTPIGTTKLERKLSRHAADMFFWNGAHWFTDMERRVAGVLICHDMLSLAEKVHIEAHGGAPIATQDLARLRSLGIDRAKAVAMYEQWRRLPDADRVYNPSFFGGQIRVANISNWTDRALAEFVSGAVRGEMDNMALTANAATMPKFLRHEWGRALGLYMGFGMHMSQTVNLRMLQRGDRNMLTAAASSLVLGLLVANMRHPDYVSQDPEDALFEAVQMSGITGVAGDMMQKLMDVSGTSMGLGYVGIDPKPWADGVDLSKANPIASQWWGFLGPPVTAAMGQKREADDYLRGIQYMIPYNNHIGWALTWDLPRQVRQTLSGK